MQAFKHLRILADLSKLSKVGDENAAGGGVEPDGGIVYCSTNYTSCCTYNSCVTNYGACYTTVVCDVYIYC